MKRTDNSGVWRVRALVAAVSMACASAAWGAGVLPAGPQVVAGAAQIGTVGGVMSVTNTPNAIINWQSFSIGQSEAVRFLQQSAGSAVLNRVVGGQISQLMGRLSSNGQVFLVNPAGILVGAGAVIDTAAFVGSTLQMLDQDFVAGRLKFQGDATSGKIVNQGWIRTGYGGAAVLIAPNIENSGLIEAPGGKIMLAAGQKITLTSLDLGGLSFEVQAPTDTAVNLGQLIADGGVVKMFAGSLKHSGDIRANALTRNEAGEIVLKAAGDVELAAGSTTLANGRTGGSIRIESDAGTARVAGNVSAAGSSGSGGSVDVLGEKVVLTGNATLDASGASTGGVIRVGGDWQGANPDVKNAQAAFVGAGVTLKADATDRGDGGKIVVWSDGDTRFLGSLSAQGGINGGNGGKAEVSGKGDLLFIGGANLGAPRGVAGNLLLDPLDLFVDAVGGLNPFIIDENTDFPNHAVTVSPATLAGINGNVTLYASRDMRFNSAISLTAAGAGLTARAGRDLQLMANVGTNNGALDLGAGRDIQLAGAISTTGGAVTIAATNNLSTSGTSSISTAGGNVGLTAKTISASALSVAGGAGNVTLTTSVDGLTTGALAGGSITATSAGSMNVQGAVNATGGVSLSSLGGSMSLSSSSGLAATGAVSLTSSSSISTRRVYTNGGTFTAQANGSSFSTSSNTIDTRPGQTGTSGGSVAITSTPSSVSTGAILAGDANVVLSGTSVSTGAVGTTGNVTLTASAGNISATVNDAASLTATATRDVSSSSSNSVSINSNSTNPGSALNATSVTSTMTGANCLSTVNCSASVSLTASNGVKINVGTVRAVAPTRTYVDSNTDTLTSKNESVTINGGSGGILAAGSSSLVSAADVTLRTDAGSGAGIGSSTTPLKVAVERRLDLRPNGEFNVQLTGSGPNRLDMTIGVANAGSYTGALTRSGLNVSVGVDTSTVTLNSMSITGGFDARVYQSDPSISLYVPNGALVAGSVLIPQGDVTGVTRHYQSSTGYPNYNVIFVPYQDYASLSASFRAAGDLTMTSFLRSASAQSRPQSTTFRSDNGSVTLATANANQDSVSISANTGVTISGGLTSQGNIGMSTNSGGVAITGAVSSGGQASVTAYAGDVTVPGGVTGNGGVNINAYSGNVNVGGAVSSDNSSSIYASGGVAIAGTVTGRYGVSVTADRGDVTINRIDATYGSVNISANGASSVVGALQDGVAPEITASGQVSITAHTIGSDSIGGNPAANPLDVAASSVVLATSGAGSSIGFSGRPVVAITPDLTINAGANFNVSTNPPTGSMDLVNLSVTASPSAVGNNGLAQVSSNGTVYRFLSDGTDFTLGGTNIAGGNPLPANQLAGGRLSLTASTGGVKLDNLDFSLPGASLNVSTQDASTGQVTQTGSTINLGSGSLSIQAQGAVSLGDLNASGLSVETYQAGAGTFAQAPGSTINLGSGSMNVYAQGAVTLRDINAGYLSVETYPAGTGTVTQAAGSTVNLGAGSMSINAAGDVTLQNVNAGSLSVTANQPGVGKVTQGVGSTIELGTGTLSIQADGDVSLEAVNAGGMTVREANSGYYTYGCLGYYAGCGVASFTANQPLTDTAQGGGTWSVAARGSITTGSLAVERVQFTTYGIDPSSGGFAGAISAGNITTGAIDAGSVTLAAGSSYYSSYNNAPVNVITGAIGASRRPDSVSITAGNDAYYYYNPVRGSVQTGAIEAGTVSIAAYGGQVNVVGNIGATASAETVSLRADSAYYGGGAYVANTPIQAGSITASGNISLYSYYNGTIQTNALKAGTRIEIQGGPLTVNGRIDLDTTGPNAVNQAFRVQSTGDIIVGGDVALGQGGSSLSSPTYNSMYMHAGGELKINGGNGSVTAADGSFLSLQTANTNTANPFRFATIYAGPSGGVRVSTQAGIEQTLASGSGGGITGGRVILNADAAGSAIVGSAGAALTLRETTDLTVTTGGSVKLDRTDGANPIPLLTNVDISQSDATRSFSLTGYASGSSQSVTLTPGGGGAVVSATTDDNVPMNFRYQNSGSSNATITGAGIFTKGGEVILDSTHGGVNTGAIDTRDPSIPGSGNTINLSAGAGGPMNVSGALNAGSGQAILQGPSVTGLGSITSTDRVQVTAYAGDIGTDPGSGGTALAINAPSVTLQASRTTPAFGNVYAALSGTTDLTLSAQNGFKVGTNTDLVMLDLTTYGNGTGPVVLTAPGQTYSFARNGNVLELGGVSGVRLSSFNLNVSRDTGLADGNITVLGSTASDSLYLYAQDTLKFDGSASALGVANPSQTFYANQMVLQGNVTLAAGNYQYAYAYNTFDFTGRGTLSSGGSQQINGQGGLALQASGGTINVTSTGSQSISANSGGNLAITGGAAAGEKVIVTAAGSQSISTYTGSLVLQGGSASGATVSVTATGSGSQSISSTYGGILLQGGSGDGAAVSASATGSGSQSISTYNSNIVLQGGSANAASVTVSKTGSGSQSINSSYGSISLLGGNTVGTTDASVTVSSAGSQSISTYDYGSGSILLQAGNANRASVSVTTSGTASQSISAGGSVTLQAGQGSNATGGTDSSVTVSTAGSQTLRAAYSGSGSILLQGGSADRNAVSVRKTGAGAQSIVAGRSDDTGPGANITLQGGNTAGTTGASVEVVGDGSSQSVYAQGTIAVRGGDGADAFAAIRSTATAGTQDIGDALYYYNYSSYVGSGTSSPPPSAPSAPSSSNRNPTDGVALQAGGGSGSYSLVQASGRQYVEAQNNVSVAGGAGDGAYARITKTGTGEQRIGTVDYSIYDHTDYYSYYGYRYDYFHYHRPLANVAVSAGAGIGSFAKIDTDTVQRVSPTTSLTVQGAGTGAYGLISTTATDQYIGTSSYGNATTQISAGAGAGAYAAIRSSGAQTIDLGNTTLSGGSGDASRADITAATSQTLNLGSLSMTGGSNRATDAFIRADSGQTLYAGTTILTGGTGTSGGTASAYIFNDRGSQYLSLGDLSVRSGADYAAASIYTQGTGQTVYAGSITLGTTAGANTLGTSYATIEHLGTGAQTISSYGISINNQHASGTVGILSSGAQSITASGSVSVQTAAAGDARVTANGSQDITAYGALTVASSSAATALVKAAGVQTIGTSGAVTVTASGAGIAAIEAGAGTQAIRGTSALPANADDGQIASAYSNSWNGGVLVQATGAGGTARIKSFGGGQTILGSYLRVDTSANGTALVEANGAQWVHTTGSGLRVRAMGGGTATLTTSGYQLLQVDYPELMRGSGSGSIVVGDAAAAGASKIHAASQDVFAKTISVVGGNVLTARSEIDVTGVQNISLVGSASLAVGNAASAAPSLIDPVTQSILVNGTISVTGGSGAGAVSGIVGGGDQTVLGTQGNISVTGGAGTNAFGEIITAGSIQRIGTSGSFTLTGGAGTNADSIIGANGGTAQTFVTCGSGTCSFTAIPSVNNPFVNSTTDVGVYYNPIDVPLAQIIAATGGAPPSEAALPGTPFDPTALTLWSPNLDLNPEGDEPDFLRGRRLPVCR